LLASLEFNVIDVTQPTGAWVYVDQVEGSKLDNYGVLGTEIISNKLNNAADTCETGLDNTFTNNETCKGLCRSNGKIGSTGTTSINGNLYYLDIDGSRKEYVPGSLKVHIRDSNGV